MTLTTGTMTTQPGTALLENLTRRVERIRAEIVAIEARLAGIDPADGRPVRPASPGLRTQLACNLIAEREALAYWTDALGEAMLRDALTRPAHT
jgi:hypothetical protein